jgi:hypothetical protein
MKRWGWLSVSSLYLLIGTIAGSGGAIEHIVYMTSPIFLTLATFLGIIAQALMFGYLPCSGSGGLITHGLSI